MKNLYKFISVTILLGNASIGGMDRSDLKDSAVLDDINHTQQGELADLQVGNVGDKRSLGVVSEGSFGKPDSSDAVSMHDMMVSLMARVQKQDLMIERQNEIIGSFTSKYDALNLQFDELSHCVKTHGTQINAIKDQLGYVAEFYRKVFEKCQDISAGILFFTKNVDQQNEKNDKRFEDYLNRCRIFENGIKKDFSRICKLIESNKQNADTNWLALKKGVQNSIVALQTALVSDGDISRTDRGQRVNPFCGGEAISSTCSSSLSSQAYNEVSLHDQNLSFDLAYDFSLEDGLACFDDESTCTSDLEPCMQSSPIINACASSSSSSSSSSSCAKRPWSASDQRENVSNKKRQKSGGPVQEK